MSGKRYPEEFRTEVVKQIVDRGYSAQEVSQRLVVSAHSLYKWLKDSRRWGEKAQTGELESIRQENMRLKSELKRAEEERDVLRIAAAYCGRASE